MAYVDFDYSGWIIAEAFCDQLRRYGAEVNHLGFLIRPQRFTPAELKRLAIPLPANGISVAGRIRAWLRKSGGVHGKALGIHCDHLRHLERVRAAFEQEMALAGLSL